MQLRPKPELEIHHTYAYKTVRLPSSTHFQFSVCKRSYYRTYANYVTEGLNPAPFLTQMPLQDKLSNEYDGQQTELDQTIVRRILLFPFRFCVKKKNSIKSILRRYVPMFPRDKTNIPKQAGVRQSKLLNKFCCGIN
jgi:hypothetical protein